MKKLIIFLFIFNFTNLYSSDFKFEKISDDLNKPWSLSFINKEKIILTEKSGKLYVLNLKNKQNVFLERNKCISFANKNKMFITIK